MSNIATNEYKNKILTLPNILSCIRIGLIPIIVWTVSQGKHFLAGIVVVISGITDLLDGYIARKFKMTSDLGKILDPIADKATQIVVALLLVIRFRLMILPIAMLVLKEVFMAVSGYAIIKHCGIVLGAEWHGKLATAVLTATFCLHLLWQKIPDIFSHLTIILSFAALLISFVLYFIRNTSHLKKNKGCDY